MYAIDESTGGLTVSHKLLLPTKDYPGCPGPVTGNINTVDTEQITIKKIYNKILIYVYLIPLDACNILVED